MNNFIKQCTCALIANSLSGCSILGSVTDKLYKDIPPMELSSGIVAAVAINNSGAIEYLAIPAGKSVFTGEDFDMLATQLMSAPVNSAEIKAKKKALGVQMLRASDIACNKYLTEISANDRITRTGLGLGALVMTTTAGVLKQGTTTRILSNVASFAQGAEAELEQQLLGGGAAGDLIEAVKLGRQIRRNDLKARLLGREKVGDKPKVEASFEGFYISFADYHDSCGVTFGLQVIEDALKDRMSEENL